jgi:hypothetical protein
MIVKEDVLQYKELYAFGDMHMIGERRQGWIRLMV